MQMWLEQLMIQHTHTHTHTRARARAVEPRGYYK